MLISHLHTDHEHLGASLGMNGRPVVADCFNLLHAGYTEANKQVKVPEDHDSSSGTKDNKEHPDGHVRLLPRLIPLCTGIPSVHGDLPAYAQQILTAV